MSKTRWLVVAVDTVSLVLTACRASENDRTVVGVVVNYQGDLVNVDSFTVRTESGEVLQMRPADDGDFAFPLPHLREHMTTADPIEVEFMEESGSMVVTAISDAG